MEEIFLIRRNNKEGTVSKLSYKQTPGHLALK
jgi:hypothetical protein